MIVCGHGDVADFCKKHHMVIVETHEGDLLDYIGKARILVTDQKITEVEYYFVKGELIKRGVELVSTIHKDNVELLKLTPYMSRREKSGGRSKFGFRKADGEEVLTETGRAIVKRIFELRDAGYSYRGISEDEGVHYPDGRKLNISTIQIIIKNRKIYEKEGL